MMIEIEHTAIGGGCKDTCASNFYIDHLTVTQLRRRAADDRADTMTLAGRLSAEAVAMLLADAERCEARADELEAAQRHLQPTFATVRWAGLLNRRALALA